MSRLTKDRALARWAAPALGLWLLMGGQGRAQSVTDGPLSASGADAPVSAKSSLARSASAKLSAAKTRSAKKARSTSALPSEVPAGAAPRAAKPISPKATKAVAPDDPLSLGMKWNGSNDNAEQIRTQNYGGGAAGTGASVGLKYHF